MIFAMESLIALQEKMSSIVVSYNISYFVQFTHVKPDSTLYPPDTKDYVRSFNLISTRKMMEVDFIIQDVSLESVSTLHQI